MTNRSTFLRLGAALALVAGPAFAQSSESLKGSVDVGSQSGAGWNSPRAQQYQVVPQGTGLYDLRIYWRGAAGYWMDLEGQDVATKSQSMQMTGGKTGSFKWLLGYDENPNWNSTGQTLYTETSPGVFRLPDALRAQMQATYWTPGAGSITVASTDPRNVALGAALGFYTLPAPYTALNGNYQMDTVDLRTQRRTGRAGFEFTGLENWRIGVEYSQERRDGKFATTIYDGTTIAEVAAPIDYKTQNMALTAQYANKMWFAQAGVDYSKFEDGVQSIRVDNPMRLAFDPAKNATTGAFLQAQAATFAMPTEPGNQANGFHFSGGVNLPMKHRVTVNYTTNTMTMDAALMPGSTVAEYLTGAPVNYVAPDFSVINAKATTTNYSAKVTGAPIPLVSYAVTFRKFEEKDKTPLYNIPFKGRGDSSVPTAQNGALGHHDGSWSKDTVKAEFTVKPIRGLRVGLAFTQDKADYEEREAKEVKDNAVTLNVDGQMSDFVLHASYTDLKRTPTYEAGRARFDWGTAGVSDPNAAANMADQSKRNAKIHNVVLTWTPAEAVSLSLNTYGVKNDFPDSPVQGLQSSDNRSTGLDVSYAVDNGITFHAAYVYETYGFDMGNQYLGANSATALITDRWTNHTDDKVDTFRFGIRARLTNKWSFASDFDYSKGRSDSAYAVNAGSSWQAGGYNMDPATSPYGFSKVPNAGPWLTQPQVVNKSTIWKTSVTYQQTRDLAFSLLYWLQRYDRADWARDRMSPYMYAVDPGWNKSLVLGAQVPSYNASVVRGSISYRF